MPRVMGVLTHIDTLPQKQIKKQKKKIKHRFGVEICKVVDIFKQLNFVSIFNIFILSNKVQVMIQILKRTTV